MLAVLNKPTPGLRNLFFDYQKAKVRIVVLPIVDGKTCWNCTLELLERAYPLQELRRKWHPNPINTEYQPMFTTQHEWTNVKFVIEVWRPDRYWTLWMLTSHTVEIAPRSHSIQQHV
jgi:hypothetical protein